MAGEAFAFAIMLAAAYALVRFIAWIEPDIAEALGNATDGDGAGEAGADSAAGHNEHAQVAPRTSTEGSL